jgi:hypothetical protein
MVPTEGKPMGVQNAVRDETQAAAFEVAGLSHRWSVPHSETAGGRVASLNASMIIREHVT